MGGVPSSPRSRAAALLALAGVAMLCWRRKQIKAWLIIQIIIRMIPKPPFRIGERPHPPAPDYAKPSSWAAYPGKVSTAELVPEGEEAVPDGARPADCFYVHPTGFYSAEAWNQPLPWAAADEMTDMMLAGQAAPFNATCRVFAPHYRQATLASYFTDKESGRGALDLAYGDVRRAFEHFLTQTGVRPIVVASHSQGGHHTPRLLEEFFERDPALRARLVCCYLVGSTLPMDKFARAFPTLHPCGGPRDTGCVAGWDAKGEGVARRLADTFAEHPGNWYSAPGEPRGVWEAVDPARPVLCTNPLTWSGAAGRAPAARHAGCAQVDVEGWAPGVRVTNKDYLADRVRGWRPRAIRRRWAGEVWAEAGLRSSMLMVKDMPEWEAELEVINGGSYHCVDYDLFWFNIRANVAERVAAFVELKLG